MNLGPVLDRVLYHKGALYAESQVGTELGSCYRIIYHASEVNPKPMLYFTLCGAPVTEMPADLDWSLMVTDRKKKADAETS
jgi:hypothetical protein